MCLPQPGDSPSAFPGLSCGLSFGFFAPFRSWASYDNGLYISLARFWFSSLPATLNCYSCRNDLILLDPFLGQPFIPFLNGLSRALFCFHSWAPMSLWGSLWASTAQLLSLGFLACLLIPHSHGLFTNFIGLPRPNNLILIFGVHEPAINPLLSLFTLPWAYGDPFSLF